MKTKILFSLIISFATQLTSAQVLYNEDFNSLIIGNLGTDSTGGIVGQGGWWTMNSLGAAYNGNNDFRIVAEQGRGNVMEISGPNLSFPSPIANVIEQRGLHTLWNSRAAGNNVLKLEYDFFTGNVAFPTSSVVSFANNLRFTDYTGQFVQVFYVSHLSSINVRCNGCGTPTIADILQPTTVPRNTWLKFELYLDYVNKESYFTIPSLGVSGVSGWVSSFDLSSIMFHIYTSGSNQSFYKFDNIIISAIKNTPLSVKNDFVSSKFSVFPNPVSDVVTITNNENIGIENIQVFDISGKSVHLKTFNYENEVKLNIEDLALGIYTLHIKTKEGVAVKKIIKN